MKQLPKLHVCTNGDVTAVMTEIHRQKLREHKGCLSGEATWRVLRVRAPGFSVFTFCSANSIIENQRRGGYFTGTHGDLLKLFEDGGLVRVEDTFYVPFASLDLGQMRAEARFIASPEDFRLAFGASAATCLLPAPLFADEHIRQSA